MIMDINRELKRVSFEIQAFEHASEKEMKRYLEEHPNADPKDHWAKKTTFRDKAQGLSDSVKQFGEDLRQRVRPSGEKKIYKSIESIPMSREEEEKYSNRIHTSITGGLEELKHFTGDFAVAKGFRNILQKIVGSKHLIKEFRDKGHQGVSEEERQKWGKALGDLPVFVQSATKAIQDLSKENPGRVKYWVDTYEKERKKRPDLFEFKSKPNKKVTSPFMH